MWKKNWLVVKSAGLDCNRTVNRLTKICAKQAKIRSKIRFFVIFSSLVH